MKRVTALGLKWEWMHSFWMPFIFIPFAMPISYFYVGLRMHQIKWFLFGYAYFLVINGGTYILLRQETLSEDTIVFIVIAMVITFGNGFFHAFEMRKVYLSFLTENMNKHIKQVLVDKEQERLRLLTEKERQYPTNVLTRNEIYKLQSSKTKFAKTEKEKLRKPTVININKATYEEIKVLTFMDSFLANKIIQQRKTNEPYKSFNHLAHETGIQSHFLIQAKEYITFSDDDIKTAQEKLEAKQQAESNNKSSLSGRYVDF